MVDLGLLLMAIGWILICGGISLCVAVVVGTLLYQKWKGRQNGKG